MTFLRSSKSYKQSSLSDVMHPKRVPAFVQLERGKDEILQHEESATRPPYQAPTAFLNTPVSPVKKPIQATRTSRKVMTVGILVVCGVFVVYGVVSGALATKEKILMESKQGYDDLAQATELLKAKQYEGAVQHFESARQFFDQASKRFTLLGGPLLDVTRYISPLSPLSSGRHAVEAGKYFALAGKPLSQLIEVATQSKKAYAQGEKISLLDLMAQSKESLREVQRLLALAQEELIVVSIGDIPKDKQEKFLQVKDGLPALLGILSGFEKNERIIEELLGGNGPRTYLFLLQNNHEMRATGGFIGTYALVDINQGVIRRFFVDGIFNPDGQLKENIIPPKPIQKISAGWSLHDSNWFPDFPASAEKAISFYEKTGGPTVDGVITLTPTVMQKLLAVIGPISMPQYGLTVDADNFIPVLQEQVEVKYDKELNQPKKILADLTRLLIEKAFALQDRATTGRIAEALVSGLNEKHMLLYVRQPDFERLIDEVGWSGRILETSKDYLAVIHSNINGYKTDGVIDERIMHEAKIGDDGSIVDTVTVTRTHRGGDTPYDWWNKVNADYVRIYVPKGSLLLTSEGTTWEFPAPPLDYARLGFKKDADVDREESAEVVDQKTGVRISEDAGKTVFGAWAYVSPKESVTLRFQYRLPFRLDPKALALGDPQSYAVLFQKQSGSPGSALLMSVTYPESFHVIWQTEPNLVPYGREWRRETNLKTDVFHGMVFGKE